MNIKIYHLIPAGALAVCACGAPAATTTNPTPNATDNQATHTEERTMTTSTDDATAPSGYEFDIVTLDPQPILTMRFRVAPDQVSAKLAEVLPAVYGYAMQSGATPSGQPFSRYHAFGADAIDMEAGVPTSQPGADQGDIKASSLPGGRVAVTWHVGPYHRLTEAHTALAAWVDESEHTAAPGPWEVYVTDPGKEPDPSKWRTQVFLPLAE